MDEVQKPEAVLARYDESEARPQFPNAWLAEALREAIRQRDEAQEEAWTARNAHLDTRAAAARLREDVANLKLECEVAEAEARRLREGLEYISKLAPTDDVSEAWLKARAFLQQIEGS